METAGSAAACLPLFAHIHMDDQSCRGHGTSLILLLMMMNPDSILVPHPPLLSSSSIARSLSYLLVFKIQNWPAQDARVHHPLAAIVCVVQTLRCNRFGYLYQKRNRDALLHACMHHAKVISVAAILQARIAATVCSFGTRQAQLYNPHIWAFYNHRSNLS